MYRCKILERLRKLVRVLVDGFCEKKFIIYNFKGTDQLHSTAQLVSVFVFACKKPVSASMMQLLW